MMRQLRVPVLLVLTACLGAAGWRLMCTTFMIHDDEGYVLLSLRNFSAHGRLYEGGVFTQYGPFPFLYYDAWHRLLTVPIDNLLGRVMATLHWSITALAAGLLAWRLSHRYWTAVLSLVAVFGYLWQTTWEPTHPGGLIAMLAAGGLALAVEAWQRGHSRTAFAILGFFGAALTLTKINVGVLWCCSVGAGLLLESGGVWRGRGAWLAAAGLALLPFVLMRPLLGEPWVRNLGMMTAVTGAALCLPMTAAPPSLRRGHWLAAAAGFLGVGLVIIAGTLSRGTSLDALVRGVALDPLRHPVHFQVRFTWDNLSWLLEAVSLAIGIAWCARPTLRPWLRDGVAGLRLAAFAAFLWHLRTWLGVPGLGGLIRYGLPLAPLFLLPLLEAPAHDARWRTARLVALVASLQVLHTYPVAGTQMAWGAFLLVPLCVDGIREAGDHCSRRLAHAWPGVILAGLGVFAAAVQAWLLSSETNRRWRTSEPLNVPGLEFLRPQENVRQALGIVTANARLHADVLFSRPGMFGFNLWTGVPTPTLRNATHWFWLLSPADQEAIAARLRSATRPVVISSQPMIDLLRDRMDIVITGSLQDYLQQDYHPLFTVAGYEFLVPRTSQAAPFFVAQNFRARTEDSNEPALIAVNLSAHSQSIARIVLRDVRWPDRVLVSWDRANSQALLQPIDLAGRAHGELRAAAWPLQIDGLQQLRLFHRSRLPADRPELELLFLDATGRSVFEACYDPAANVSLPPAGG